VIDFKSGKFFVQQIIYSLKMKTIVAINNLSDLKNATSEMGISTATLALQLLPFPLPAKVSIVT
jgi:hypothetical protein